jgi:hypothetical protein
MGGALQHADLRRWREISIRPKDEFLPIWMRWLVGFLQRVLQAPSRPGCRLIHVDEVDHNQTGQVAQAQLPRRFLRRLKVCSSAVASIFFPGGLANSRLMANEASAWLITSIPTGHVR